MVLVTAVAAVFLASGGASAQDEGVIATYSGTGGTTARPFTVDSGWEIQWDAKGSIFQVFLHSGAGEMLGVAVNQQGAGAGNSYQPGSGEYYLQVNAIGPWEAKVVRVTEPIKVSTASTFTGAGGRNTRPFAVDGRWEIQWDAKGSLFQVYLYSEDGGLVGVPVNQQGPGDGASFQPRGGTYYLQVNAMGPWNIVISPLDR